MAGLILAVGGGDRQVSAPMLPNLRREPAGRNRPGSAWALRPLRMKRNGGLCGRRHDRPQLMRTSLGSR